MQRLNARVCVVTGAGRGIGKGIAQRLLEEGARVWICDTHRERLAQAAQELAVLGDVGQSLTDVSNRAAVAAMCTAVLDRWGRVDVLVNNAGIARVQPFLDLSDADWEQTLAVNLRGPFICAQIFARQMIAQGGGVIINIASTNGLRGQPRLVDYGASKAGLLNLTLSLAVELADVGIRVNAVCPGSIWTELSSESGWSDAAWERLRTQIPQRRMGEPADIAAAVAYLASDDARFVTGHALVVDGGLLAPQFHLPLE
jgi:NAD(P)-dependent dehydrogenase (short-subunit alcohol dehydrogenase family)